VTKSLRFISAIFFLLLIPGVTRGEAPAPAGKAAPAIIAVIDMQKIQEESLAAKSVQQQLEAQRAKFQSEISGEEGDLRQAEKDLVKMRDTVAPDVYAEKEQQLRQRFASVERHVQSRRKALDQAFTDSMNEVRDKLLEIVSVVAKARGSNLVLVKQQALWSDKNMDITGEVLARLNKDLPRVQVKVAADDDQAAQAKPSADKPATLLKKKAR